MYWIALTDCDGFRIDTVKHVSYEQARNFCGAIKEFAINLGKRDFFLVAYLRTAAITAARAGFPVLRSGRQYLRPVSVFGEPFGPARAGELLGGHASSPTRRRCASSTRTGSRLAVRMCWLMRNSTCRVRR
jgi:hypothetical protein